MWPGPESPLRNQIPISHHYAPGTRQNLRADTAFSLNRQGRGRALVPPLRPPEPLHWDTTAFRDGPYRLTVTAWDIVGNRAAESIDVVIANNV